jgi:hypothetical protein
MMFTVLRITFAFCLLAGVRFTADSRREEKREGTLGFLFLTNLRGYDVVLGKLVVSSLNSLYALLAVLPLLGLPLLLGGVTGTEFWRMILVLVNTLFFSLALGILVSALGREERQVTLQTLFLLLAITFALPAIWKGATTLTIRVWISFPCPAQPTPSASPACPPRFQAHTISAFPCGLSLRCPQSASALPACFCRGRSGRPAGLARLDLKEVTGFNGDSAPSPAASSVAASRARAIPFSGCSRAIACPNSASGSSPRSPPRLPFSYLSPSRGKCRGPGNGW